MNLVGLDDKGNSFPQELSGGSSSGVAIAGDDCEQAKLLIADEPTGNRIRRSRMRIATLLEKINRE